MSLGSFRQKPIRRRWVLPFLTALAVGVVTVVVASALGVLTGSPSQFESNDGNMIVNSTHDWANVPFTSLTDPAATATDDSWVNGEKLDTQCAQLGTNKNQAKNDFTNIAAYSETAANGDLFVYGATIRVAPNGDANENVELNQTAGTTACPINRTQGDKLLVFNYLNGGTTLDLHILTWVDGPGFTDNGNGGNPYSATCVVSHDTAPCFSSTVIQPDATTFEGQVSQAPIPLAQNPISSADLAAGTFAEFGVNLTNAIGVSGNVCNPFHQADWESKASASFSANPEDVKIQGSLITNCGTITIIKHTDPGDIDQNFSYTSNIPGTGNSSFMLNDHATDTRTMTEVHSGSYTVTEGAEPAGFGLESLTCTATGGSSGSQDATNPAQANITLTGGGSVTCTYVNQQLAGAIRVTKVSSKTGHAPLAGAQFTYTGSDNVAHNFPLTGADGTACVDGLQFGTYAVAETSAPTGYLKDSTPQNVTIGAANAGSTCAGAGTPATPTNNFVDTPLSTITLGFHSLGGPNVTSATVQCTDEASMANLPEGDATKTLGNGTSTLIPGQYICTVVVDP